MKDYISCTNLTRICTKFFVPEQDISYIDGDIIFVFPLLIRFFKMPNCKVTLVSTGCDQNIEHFCSKEQFECITNDQNLIKWIITYSGFPHHEKIEKVYIGCEENIEILKENFSTYDKKINDIFYINTICTNPNNRIFLPRNSKLERETFLKEMSKYRYIYCACGSGMTTAKVFEACALGCIPIIQTSDGTRTLFDSLGIQYISLPGVITSYINFTEPFFRRSKYIHRNKGIQNNIDMLKYDYPEFKMSHEDALKITGNFQNMCNQIKNFISIEPWDKDLIFSIK